MICKNLRITVSKYVATVTPTPHYVGVSNTLIPFFFVFMVYLNNFPNSVCLSDQTKQALKAVMLHTWLCMEVENIRFSDDDSPQPTEKDDCTTSLSDAGAYLREELSISIVNALKKWLNNGGINSDCITI